jgi:hypothetical protein
VNAGAAARGAVVPNLPLVYLKLHKTGSETIEAWVDSLARSTRRQSASHTRYAWPSKSEELPFKMRSEANPAYAAGQALHPDAPRYACRPGHETLRIFKAGGFEALRTCLVPVPARVLVVATFREPVRRFFSSLFYFQSRRSQLSGALGAVLNGTAPLTVAYARTLEAGVFCDYCARGYPRPVEEYAYYLGGSAARLDGRDRGRVLDSPAALRNALDAVAKLDVVGLTEDLDTFAFLVGRAMGLAAPPPCPGARNTAGNSGVGRRRRLRGVSWHNVTLSEDLEASVRKRHPNDVRVFAAVEARYRRDLAALSEEEARGAADFKLACALRAGAAAGAAAAPYGTNETLERFSAAPSIKWLHVPQVGHDAPEFSLAPRGPGPS